MKRRRLGTADANADEDVKPPIEGLSDDDEDELSLLKVRPHALCARSFRVADRHTAPVCVIPGPALPYHG